MTLYINNNEAFQTVNESISLYAASALTIEYSVDGINYVPVNLSSVTSYPDNIVIACKSGTYFRISGISSPILVNN